MPTQPLSPLEQQQQARVTTITSPPPDEPRRRKRRKKRRKKKPTLLEQLYNYVSSAGGACFGSRPPDKKEKAKRREPRFERGVSFLERTLRARRVFPRKGPVAALGLLASTPLLGRGQHTPSPPPRYRSLSKPNSPQKEKTNWEEKTS